MVQHHLPTLQPDTRPGTLGLMPALVLTSSFLQPMKKEYSPAAHLVCPIQGSFVVPLVQGLGQQPQAFASPFLRRRLDPWPGLLGNNTFGLMWLQHTRDTLGTDLCAVCVQLQEQERVEGQSS